jgi:hypothetical protein
MKFLVFFLQGTVHPVTTISSSDVEKAYLAFCAPGSDAKAATLKFQAGKHSYELDFKGTPTCGAEPSLWVQPFHVNLGAWEDAGKESVCSSRKAERPIDT